MINYCRCSALSVLLGIIWSSSAVLAQSPTDGLQFEPVAAGVQNPTQVTNAGDGSGRLFAISQFGTIRVLVGSTFLEEPFLDISDQVHCCSEDGLLGVAFHPDYASNGRFFVRYTDRNANNILAGFRVSEDDPNRADPDSEEIILLVPQPSVSHGGLKRSTQHPARRENVKRKPMTAKEKRRGRLALVCMSLQ